MENKIKKLKSANTMRQKYEPAMQWDVQGKTVCAHARVHALMMRHLPVHVCAPQQSYGTQQQE